MATTSTGAPPRRPSSKPKPRIIDKCSDGHAEIKYHRDDWPRYSFKRPPKTGIYFSRCPLCRLRLTGTENAQEGAIKAAETERDTAITQRDIAESQRDMAQDRVRELEEQLRDLTGP
jgi:hypothetical protein